MVSGPLLGVSEQSAAAALAKELRDKLTPDQIIELMKQATSASAPARGLHMIISRRSG
jgi:hypothetical protein